MCSKLSYIYPQSRVQSIIDILSTTKHHAFPVVTMSRRESGEEDREMEVRGAEKKENKKHKNLT